MVTVSTPDSSLHTPIRYPALSGPNSNLPDISLYLTYIPVPAPMESKAIIGMLSINPPSELSHFVGTYFSIVKPTSKLVPPTSDDTRFLMPYSSAMNLDPIIPPIGPETIVGMSDFEYGDIVPP